MQHLPEGGEGTLGLLHVRQVAAPQVDVEHLHQASLEQLTKQAGTARQPHSAETCSQKAIAKSYPNGSFLQPRHMLCQKWRFSFGTLLHVLFVIGRE